MFLDRRRKNERYNSSLGCHQSLCVTSGTGRNFGMQSKKIFLDECVAFLFPENWSLELALLAFSVRRRAKLALARTCNRMGEILMDHTNPDPLNP